MTVTLTPFFSPILVNSPFSLQILPHVHVVLFCFGPTEFKQDHLNMGIELPNGVWWTHQWLHKERQCHFFIQNLLVKNSSGCGTLLSLSPSTIDWEKPALQKPSVSQKELLWSSDWNDCVMLPWEQFSALLRMCQLFYSLCPFFCDTGNSFFSLSFWDYNYNISCFTFYPSKPSHIFPPYLFQIHGLFSAIVIVFVYVCVYIYIFFLNIISSVCTSDNSF